MSYYTSCTLSDNVRAFHNITPDTLVIRHYIFGSASLSSQEMLSINFDFGSIFNIQNFNEIFLLLGRFHAHTEPVGCRQFHFSVTI